jgi:murein endopeptidase
VLSVGLLAALLAAAPPSVSPGSVSLGNASVSLGDASGGTLRHGKALLSAGGHHRVLRSTRARGYHYGTDELIGALQRAAARVASEHPGSSLVVGNLSRKRGGDIRPSASHNSGRDADLAFFATDKRGRPVMAKRFSRFNRRLRASRGLRFDASRNWSLVKALLLDQRVQVQWLFCAEWLAEALIAHARRIGEPAELIRRATAVLSQPANSSSHADHFHVRLYCALHERLQGCRNYGPTHAGVDDYAAQVLEHTRSLVRQFADPDVEVAGRATRLVGEIRGHTAIEGLIPALGDPRHPVRAGAARSLGLLDGAEVAVPALVQHTTRALAEHDRAWAHQLIGVLGRIADPRAGRALIAALTIEPKRHVRTRVLAARGLATLAYAPAVPALIGSLNPSEPTLAGAALDALHRITNHDLGRGRRVAPKWRRWWRRYRDQSRMEWVRAGFIRSHDVRFRRSTQALKDLVELVRKGGAVGFNARAMIGELTGFTVAKEHFSSWQLYRFYKSWLAQRR